MYCNLGQKSLYNYRLNGQLVTLRWILRILEPIDTFGDKTSSLAHLLNILIVNIAT